jgi:hypothetical protein
MKTVSGPRRKAVTLIEAVLFISIALAVIVGGLVFYQQASLALKVMNVKRHVQAAIVETRTIQDRTHVWSYPNPGGDITDLLKDYGALSAVSDGFGDMIITFNVHKVYDTSAPSGICSAVVVNAQIAYIPVAACTRLVVIDDQYQGALGTGMVEIYTHQRIGGVLTTSTLHPPVTPADAGQFCSYDGRLSAGQNVMVVVSFILEPPTPESELAIGCGP